LSVGGIYRVKGLFIAGTYADDTHTHTKPLLHLRHSTVFRGP
jgi:hypothetical protein